MVAYEKLCLSERPDWVVVVGDVNSTMACAITAKKLCLPVAHLEAGLRSGDLTMPEEINRLVTDAICDLLWTPSPDAVEHLRQAGVPESKIEPVGNVMIDSLEMLRERIEAAEPLNHIPTHGRCFGTDSTGFSCASPDGSGSPTIWFVGPGTRMSLSFLVCSPGVHSVHVSGVSLSSGDYRFRGDPGGDHLFRDSLSDPPGHDGATGYVEGNQSPDSCG